MRTGHRSGRDPAAARREDRSARPSSAPPGDRRAPGARTAGGAQGADPAGRHGRAGPPRWPMRSASRPSRTSGTMAARASTCPAASPAGSGCCGPPCPGTPRPGRRRRGSNRADRRRPRRSARRSAPACARPAPRACGGTRRARRSRNPGTRARCSRGGGPRRAPGRRTAGLPRARRAVTRCMGPPWWCPAPRSPPNPGTGWPRCTGAPPVWCAGPPTGTPRPRAPGAVAPTTGMPSWLRWPTGRLPMGRPRIRSPAPGSPTPWSARPATPGPARPRDGGPGVEARRGGYRAPAATGPPDPRVRMRAGPAVRRRGPR